LEDAVLRLLVSHQPWIQPNRRIKWPAPRSRVRELCLIGRPATVESQPPSRHEPQPTTMKSIKNLTRFDYETTAFQGWRLGVCNKGAKFSKYFSDKRHGGGKKSFAAAKAALAELRELLATAKLVDGKHTAKTIEKATKLLAKAG
jgi:hypothetical protein